MVSWSRVTGVTPTEPASMDSSIIINLKARASGNFLTVTSSRVFIHRHARLNRLKMTLS
jgi:hypothetical protein